MADMPFIKLETITQLANSLERSGKIIRPVYEQQQGHPVGFAQRFKEQLISLNGNVGAYGVINKHRGEFELNSTDDSGVIADIDQMSDLKNRID